MTITIDPKLEARLRERAKAEGLTITAYLKTILTTRCALLRRRNLKK